MTYDQAEEIVRTLDRYLEARMDERLARLDGRYDGAIVRASADAIKIREELINVIQALPSV